MCSRSKIFIISGPSGSGKTTIAQKLLSHNRTLHKPVSYTTRKKRSAEKAGRDYFFIERSEFIRRKKRKELLEATTFNKQLYGTSKLLINEALKDKKNLLLCLDTRGAFRLKKLFPCQAVSFFILPPSFATLKKRLKNRLTESGSELKARLKTAKIEVNLAKRFDYVVVNDSLFKAVRKIEEVLKKKC